MKVPAEVVRALRQAGEIWIFSHVRPDGDSIGSILGAARGLDLLGKKVVRVGVDDVPYTLKFLPGTDRFVPWQEVKGKCDVHLFLDCGDLERAGEARCLVDPGAFIVNVDHHASNSRFGTVNWVETGAAAVGEMVYLLLAELGVGLDRELATALFTAIATDTGSFRYENTTPLSHRIAAECLEQGVAPQEIARQVWENQPLSAIRLLQAVLPTLHLSDDGRVASLHVTREMLERAGAAPEETEGLVTYARTIQGVEVALFFQEAEDEIKVSLRSNRYVDVSRVAAEFGGGGHPRAAGCRLRVPMEEALRRVGEAAQRALRDFSSPEAGGE